MISYTVTDIYEGPSGVFCVFENGESFERFTLLFRISDFYDAHLSIGKIVSDERFEELYEISAIAKAVVSAENIIARGDVSKKGLVLKLTKGDIEKKYAEKAAHIMEERGYINEDDQTERLAAAYCRRKCWGKKRISAELLTKGYERSAVMRAVDLVPKEEYMNALEKVTERKFQAPPEDRKERDKRIASLMRLGFSLSEINEVTARYWRVNEK